MMNLHQQLINERNIARKNDTAKYNLLTVLLGEIETELRRKGINHATYGLYEDAEVIKLLEKSIKSGKETLALKFSAKLATEIQVMESYLPEKYDRQKLIEILSSVVFTNVGEAMAFLKKNHAGLYDGKEASSVIKEILEKV